MQSAVEWYWTVMLAAAMYRSAGFVAQSGYEARTYGDGESDMRLWLREEVWYWRLQAAMVLAAFLAGVAALAERNNPDQPLNTVAYLLLVFATLLFVKGEVKAHYWRRRNGVEMAPVRWAKNLRDLGRKNR